MRELLGTFINALLSAQPDSVCGAEYGTPLRWAHQPAQRLPPRRARRPRRHHRHSDPRGPSGELLSGLALERHRRAEAALTTVVATCYCSGCPLGGWTSSSGSGNRGPVEVAGVGDGEGPGRAARRIPHKAVARGPLTFVAVDVLTEKARVAGRVVKVAVMVAPRERRGVPRSPPDPHRHHRVRLRWLSFFPDDRPRTQSCGPRDQ